ncbi:polyketide synthase [Corynascus novoguineensis]|uniref:Polyketide synthase n=1 Tax=Corynascus novoguineensis TaxID=1126955 RepID=A0AAN7HD70_9PEZI|nr:polyketide synthase [Corynascus novoguineensis]
MTYKVPIAEPIAIIGTACRFAGGATTPSRLWELLANPVDLTREIPAERFNIEAFYHPDGEHHGTTNSPKAYFIDQDHRVFDAGFFNISPKEAEAIDPQQRMLLEVVYEALESAGYTLQQYAGKKVAVFAGLMSGDYDTLSQRDELDTSQYYATGNARCILSNRISYFFNFQGPSMTIDTACSSSLVALHQAVLSLRSGECKMACVAGANLILTPENFIAESNLHMLSPTGHCRMWDAAADGYARGEGVTAMFIKPLSQALADGDHIEAIVRETGVNSDGRSRGITMPNWEAQSQLIQDTYQRSGLDPNNPEDRCQYFEAHGTGTAAGDPNEARAIEDAFFGCKKGRASNAKLLVGSVKTVIGHTEGAAGLAGLLKLVQSMQHNSVPPNLHLDRLNPNVEPYYSNLLVPTSSVTWPDVPVGQPKRGSVNSFGFGGTNAHAIIEEYIPAVHDIVARVFRPGLKIPVMLPKLHVAEHGQVCVPLLLSAPSQKSLVAIAKAYRDYLMHEPAKNIQELAWHTYSRRTAFPFRFALSGTSLSGLKNKLDKFVAETEDSHAATLGIRARPRDEQPKILGVFTGQGAQWATMSRSLFLSSKVFADTIRSLDTILQSCPDPPSWTLESEILADAHLSKVSAASVSQPLCTAVQLALIELLRRLGITFHTVLGHSSGEIAAAYAAGRLSIRDAMLISHYRGLGVHEACGSNGTKGGMMAVGLSKVEAEELCSMPKYLNRLWIAASNAPTTITLSGDVDAVHQAHDELVKQNKFARVLFVDTAYHSPHMNGLSAGYLEALNRCGITPLAGNGTVWVSSTLEQGEPSQAELSGSYWRDNMVKPVLFCEAVTAAFEGFGPFDCAIEVGPHPTLMSPVTQTMAARKFSPIPYSGLLNRKLDDRQAFADFLGWMWTHFGSSAHQIRQFVLGSLQPELVNSRIANAPTYPWDHTQKFYRESRLSRQYHFKTDKPHELLGVRTRDDNKHQLRWRNILFYDRLPWVKHHSFQGKALLPASAYLIMTVDATRIALAGRPASVVELCDVVFHSGIILEPNSSGVEVLFNLTIEHEAQNVIEASFKLTSAIADGRSEMKMNFSGTLIITLGDPFSDALPARPADRAETMHASPDAFYDMMTRTGLVYTSPFRALQTLERRYNFSSGTLKKYHHDDTTSLSVSPATLDGCLQTAFVTVSSPGDNALWTSFLPLEMKCVRFNLAICDIRDRDRDMLAVDAYLVEDTQATERTPASFIADIEIFNPEGAMEIQVQGLTVGGIGLTKPEDDYELYLTTRFDIDPDYEIISAGSVVQTATNPNLIESCQRVASFYAVQTPNILSRSSTLGLRLGQAETPVPPQPWRGETEKTLDTFIRVSPYYVTLDFIRELGKNLPELLMGMLPAVMEDAHQLVAFQQHVSRIVGQVSHKYPRMSVLGLLGPEMGMNEHVVVGLKDSFASYRLGSEPETNLDARIPPNDPIRRRIAVNKVDLDVTEPELDTLSDLVLLSTSVIEPHKMASTLKMLRRMMRPGGFLVLVNVSRSPLKDRIRRYAGFSTTSTSALPSPPDWPDLLDQCGFGYAMKNGNQYYPPGFSIIVRQADSPEKSSLLLPFANPGQPTLTDRLLVVGGEKTSTAVISSRVCSALTTRCGAVEQARTLESVDPEHATSFSAVIILSDIDEPILATMTNKRMKAVRALFKPQMVVLWVTHDARFQNPDLAASFGFTRTLAAEIPGLVLQMLDLDTIDTATAAEAIAETFARLTKHALAGHPSANKPLWINEPEVHLKNDQRLVPRVMPWKEGNDRVNAFRRLVTNPVNTLEKAVQIVPAMSAGTSTRYDIEALYPPAGAWVLDMSTGSSKLSDLLKQTLPRNCKYTTYSTLLCNPWDEDSSLATFWDKSVALSLAQAASSEPTFTCVPMSVNDLLRAYGSIPPFQLVDWKAERTVSQLVKPLAGTRLLNPTKTYQGARHLVLCSRNPPKVRPKWQSEMMAKGITVRFESLDVTSLQQVWSFKAKLAATLPPVGGVVNGAMVLEDRVFSQMSLDTFHRVMNPKTIGSSNLNKVFNAADMDFFIMTSSFAAIGGHAGQSNYAAANMYMNGLAASRRRRGLPGSVLNIGVIYGLGFLHREKDSLYQGLEREGYPPISERDIHHMFIEAIVAGRPPKTEQEEQVYDITTGLRRFPTGNPTLHWHHDPRFGHFARRDDDDADVESALSGTASSAGPTGALSLRQKLNAATTHTELVAVLLPAFVARLRSQLQLDADISDGDTVNGRVTADHSVVELGVDSLAALEVRAWAWKALGLDLAVMKLLSGTTIADLCREIAAEILEAREAVQKREHIEKKKKKEEEEEEEAAAGGGSDHTAEEEPSGLTAPSSTAVSSRAHSVCGLSEATVASSGLEENEEGKKQ